MNIILIKYDQSEPTEILHVNDFARVKKYVYITVETKYINYTCNTHSKKARLSIITLIILLNSTFMSF